MDTFIVSDIHGDFAQLWSLLNKVGLIDDEENRTELGQNTRIISIGDLANATLKDIVSDELCLRAAPNWFDDLIVGNHESPYLWNSHDFNGYYPNPFLRSLYNNFYRCGFAKPAILIGNTLITHAGFAFKDCETAQEAFNVIEYVRVNYPGTDKDFIFDAVGRHRGGRAYIGGIFWSDWNERKNKKFSQIVGHTPQLDGVPKLYERSSNDTFTLNIDTGVKAGGSPTGVWLDDAGKIIDIIRL